MAIVRFYLKICWIDAVLLKPSRQPPHVRRRKQPVARYPDKGNFCLHPADDDIRRVKAKVSLVGISSDWLFPASDVRRLSRRFQQHGVDPAYFEIESDDGHDAFLSDVEEMSRI